MAEPRCRLSLVGLLAFGVAGVTWYAAVVYSHSDPSRGDTLDLRQQMDQSEGRDAELESHQQHFQNMQAARNQTVRELLVGRLTLSQAAVRFRDIESRWPQPGGSERATNGPQTEGERFCRDVILRARYWLEANLPSEAARVVARLEAELEGLRGPDGVVRLSVLSLPVLAQ